jgi:hypothetical protein
MNSHDTQDLDPDRGAKAVLFMLIFLPISIAAILASLVAVGIGALMDCFSDHASG